MNKIQQQIVNCTALIAGLACLPLRYYDHGSYTSPCGTTHCAGGWAAAWGIGGLRLKRYSKTPSVAGGFGDARYDLETVFGANSYYSIFSAHNGRRLWDRDDAICEIAKHINLLSTQLHWLSA